MMKITISKVQDRHLPYVAKAGFYGIDQGFIGYENRERIISGAYDQTLYERYARVCDAGLVVTQTHLTFWRSHEEPVGDGTYEAFENYFLPILEKEIELTAKMNCHAAVFHPYFEADREKSREGNLRLIEKLLPVLEQFDVTLAFENLYAKGLQEAWHSSAEDMLYYTDRVSNPHFGLCLDSGHAIIRGQNPAEFMEKIVHRLAALHMHTTLPLGDYHAVPRIYNGDNVEWERLVKALKDADYQGTFNLETSVPRNMCEKAIPIFYQLAYCIVEGLLEA